MAAAQGIHVTLRSSDGRDGFPERKLTLRPNDKVCIGRASKNTQKPELMIAPGNAFIDSPVVSREHAVLTTTAAPPVPRVYITDAGSMHGTLVNGTKLEAHKARKLHNGDVLQFGMDVTRNESFFIAHNFVFESSLPDDSFSHGFSVPDVDTSDEEDIDDVMSPPVQGYGTQTNPVNIDDFEDAGPEVIYLDADEPTLHHDLSPASEDTEERIASPPADPEIEIEEPFDVDQTAAPYSSDDDASSDDVSSVGSSDGELLQLERISQGESDVDHLSGPDLDAEVSDEGLGDSDIDRRMKMAAMQMAAMLNRQQTMARSPSPARPLSPPPLSASPTLHPPEPRAVFKSYTPGPSSPAVNAQEPEVAAPEPYLGMFDSGFGDQLYGSTAAPIQARSAHRPWGLSGYGSQFAQAPETIRGGLSEELPGTSYLSSPHADYPVDMYSQFTGSSLVGSRPYRSPSPCRNNPWTLSAASSPSESWTPPSASVTGVPTPPPAPSSECASPVQPIRRTEVSIREIVEDTTQQPPTPTSEKGSLKRKASVLEQIEDSSVEPSSVSSTEKMAISTAGVVDISPASIVEPPRKRLRSQLGGVAKRMAAYLIPGTALAVGIISQLPESFFEP